MEGSCHVNWSSIIYWKGAIHRTEIEKLFLTAKGFNTNIVQFLMSYHVIISNLHVCFFTCTISHMHRCTPDPLKLKGDWKKLKVNCISKMNS